MNAVVEIHSKMNNILNLDEAEDPRQEMMEEVVQFLYVRCQPSQGVWLAPFVYYGIGGLDDLIMLNETRRQAALIAIRTKFSDSEIASHHPIPNELDMLNLWRELKNYEDMLGP